MTDKTEPKDPTPEQILDVICGHLNKTGFGLDNPPHDFYEVDYEEGIIKKHFTHECPVTANEERVEIHLDVMGSRDDAHLCFGALLDVEGGSALLYAQCEDFFAIVEGTYDRRFLSVLARAGIQIPAYAISLICYRAIKALEREESEGTPSKAQEEIENEMIADERAKV